MKILHLQILICCMFLFSCKQGNKADTGKLLIIPKHIEIFNPYLPNIPDSTLFSGSKTKIYTLVNASCSTCLLHLKEWDDFETNINKLKDVQVIVVCESDDNFQLLKYLFESKKMDKILLPIVLDLDNKFISLNVSLLSREGDLTVLTNSNNKILLSGNPIKNKKDKKRYMRLMPDKL
jgi:hypothetical protein